MRLEFKPDNFIVVIGKRGGGKTTVIRFIVRTLDFEGTVIYDGNPPQDMDYDKERDFNDSDNITIIKRKFTAPEWDNFGEEEGRGKFIVIDEMDMVNENHPKFYKEWINTGRHWPSGGIIAGRRPTMLPRDATANADWTFIFRAKERSVQDFIKASYTDTVAEIASRLRMYEFVIVDSSQDPVARCILDKAGRKLTVLEEYPKDEEPADTLRTKRATRETAPDPRRQSANGPL